MHESVAAGGKPAAGLLDEADVDGRASRAQLVAHHVLHDMCPPSHLARRKSPDPRLARLKWLLVDKAASFFRDSLTTLFSR